MYHTPLGRFSKVDIAATKRVPIPNDASPESSRRDVSNADVFSTGTRPTAVEISSMETSAQGGVMYTVVRIDSVHVDS